MKTKPSDTLLMRRTDANAMLRMSNAISYRVLPRTRFFGRVRMADVRSALSRFARNGAEWSGGELVCVDDLNTGVSRRSLFRVLRHAPHFRVSRKVALVEVGSIDDFLYQ